MSMELRKSSFRSKSNFKLNFDTRSWGATAISIRCERQLLDLTMHSNSNYHRVPSSDYGGQEMELRLIRKQESVAAAPRCCLECT
jgi:hypothetical protein